MQEKEHWKPIKLEYQTVKMTEISILGCGWLGFPLAQELIKNGFSVKGSVRAIEKLGALSEAGIEPFLVDIDYLETDNSNFLNSKVLIVAVPSKNIEGFKTLIPNIERSKVEKVIFISSTSVYPLINEEVTELTPVLNTPLAQIEGLFLNNKNFSTTIIRFAGLIDEDRHPGNFFRDGKVIKDPDNFVNMIHRADCIEIIQSIIEKDIWNQIFNACADIHPTKRVYYSKLIKEKRNEDPVFEENMFTPWKKVSNTKLKILLDYDFKYPGIFFE